MTQIITLLIMALNLLNAVQANPNLPLSFRQNAIEIANYAIKVSQEALKNPVSQPIVSSAPKVQEVQEKIEPKPEPIQSPIQTEPTKPIPISISVQVNDPTDFDIKSNKSYGVYIFTVKFFDKEGKTIPNLPVTFLTPDNYLDFYYKQFRDIPNPSFGYTTSIIDDSKVQFTYIPLSIGMKEINIYSGNVSRRIILHDIVSLKPVRVVCSEVQTWNNTIDCYASKN